MDDAVAADGKENVPGAVHIGPGDCGKPTAILGICFALLLVMLYVSAAPTNNIGGVYGDPPLEYGSVMIDGERAHHNYVYGGENVHLHNTQYVTAFYPKDLAIGGERYDHTTVQTNLLLRGAFKTTSIRYVVSETEVQLDDHILLCGRGQIVRLGNHETTPDGMRLVVRPLDLSCAPVPSNAIMPCERDYPIVSCLDSACNISPKDTSDETDMLYVGESTEFVFYAARNTWYEL